MESPQPLPSASKPLWRAWARSQDRRSASSGVSDALSAWPPLAGVVASYLATSDEVDLEPVHQLARCRVVVPRASGAGELTMHAFDPDRIERHTFGFFQPMADTEVVDVDDLDVVLLPGLAFDRSGNRLGHGAGMYDRLLARLPAGIVRVGVTADATFVEQIPVEAHDERVDWVATESGVHRTGPILPASAQVVTDIAIRRGIAPAMVQFPEGTKTSADAAKAVGSELGSIAKSLVFLVDDAPVLVLCSGDRRVDEELLAAVCGGTAARTAPLNRVREVTGFVAGGTPAILDVTGLEVVADASLARYRWVWSAGGTPDTVYAVSLERLIAGSGARWVDVSHRSEA